MFDINRFDNSISRFNTVDALNFAEKKEIDDLFESPSYVVPFKQYLIIIESPNEGNKIKFVSLTHMLNFFAEMRLRCKEENLLDLYDIFFKNTSFKKYKDDAANCKKCHARQYSLSTDLSCIEGEHLSKQDFARIQRFKKIASAARKATLPENAMLFAYPSNIKNWRKDQKIKFAKFCKKNMVNKNEYAYFSQKVRDTGVQLPTYAQIDVWCAEVNIANPVKIAAEIRNNNKDIYVSPPINNIEKFNKWIKPYRKQIARGNLRVDWMYVDNVKDPSGEFVPSMCLIPNNAKSIAYAKLQQARIFTYLKVQDKFSPQSVDKMRNNLKKLRDKINNYNLPEKAFSQLDKVIIPALGSVPFEPARNFLLEIYGVFQAARQLPNPVSWASFFVGLPLIDLDLKEMLRIWNKGTDIERALLIGQLLGLFFGLKILKTCAIKVQAKIVEITLKPLKNSKACIINPNPDGSLTLITEKGYTYNATFSPKKGLSVKLSGYAPKAKRPQVKIVEGKTYSAQSQPKKFPSEQNLPAKKPVSSRASKPQKFQPQPAKTAPVSMAKLAEAAGKINPFKVASSALETLAAMFTDAAALMAGANGLRPAYIGASNNVVPGNGKINKDARPTVDNTSILQAQGKPGRGKKPIPADKRALEPFIDLSSKMMFNGMCMQAQIAHSHYVSCIAKSIAKDAEIVVLHTGDIHGYVAPGTLSGGSFAHTIARINQLRKQYPGRVLLLDAGDMYSGEPLSNMFQGKPVVDVMNHANYDAAAVGNHDFDWGQKVLSDRKNESAFPFLAANIKKADGTLLFAPYIIKEVDGVKIAVLGIAAEETPYTTSPGVTNGLIFDNPVETFNKYYPKLKNEGADIIIVLSHQGIEKDIEFARVTERTDLIIGGHSHAPIAKPDENGVIISHAGYQGKYLGVVILTVNKETKKITNTTQNMENTAAYPSKIDPDKTAQNMISRYDDLMKEKMNEVLAINETELKNKEKSAGDKQDIPLGNFICDAIRESSGADIAFLNPGGIRDSLPKGNITLGDVTRCIPFDNTLITMELKGKDIQAALNKAFSPGVRGLFLSGMKLVFNPNGANGPIEEVYVKNGNTGKFEKIDPEKTYKVATNSLIALGDKPEYVDLKRGKNIKEGENVRTVVAGHLRGKKTLDYKFESRIEIKK